MKRLLIVLAGVVLLFPGTVYGQDTGATIDFQSRDQDLWIRAVISSEEKGPIEAVWRQGGQAVTERGDEVVWGHFHASPSDVTWGNLNNPDLFVKIWFDVGGRLDVNFFHVSVPDIEVYSAYPTGDTADQQGTTTMILRYIRQYYENDQSFSDGQDEDGMPAPGYTETNSPLAYPTINNLDIGSSIISEEMGPIDALWFQGGLDTTERGDQVVWGFFYANPQDVTWGSQENPDLYVKIWFDLSGRIDVNFFHVSVPDIEVYSDYPRDGSYDQTGTTIMADRYTRQEYVRAEPPSTYTNSLGMTFFLIPASTFTMGSPEDELDRRPDEPLHEVTISNSYYLQTTEVTQAQWEAVMGNNPAAFSGCSDCPVDQVSWDDAQEFVTALNAMGEGTYRLPTEAEWEYSGRAGSTTAFANGDITVSDCEYEPDLDVMGWYCYNSESMTHPVAQKSANSWGLYDMHGNVWEWCQDWYGEYPTDPVTDPTGPATGTERVFRGGSWGSRPGGLRCAARGRDDSDSRYTHLGLRLARDL